MALRVLSISTFEGNDQSHETKEDHSSTIDWEEATIRIAGSFATLHLDSVSPISTDIYSPSNATDNRDSPQSSVDHSNPSIELQPVPDPNSINSIPDQIQNELSKPIKQSKSNMSYWIYINFIFGSILLTSGSFFWIIDHHLTENDYYTLVTFAWFAGGASFHLGTYSSYYAIINDVNIKENKPKRSFCCYAGKKTIGYWIAATYLLGACSYRIPSLCSVLNIQFPRDTLYWYIFKQAPTILGGIFYGLGGLGEVIGIFQKGTTPSKTAKIIAYLDGIAGLGFFVGSIQLYVDDEDLLFYFAEIPYTTASICYLITSVLGFFNLISARNGNVIDIFFTCLYSVTLAIAFTGIAYAALCERYKDWMKGFIMATILSFGVLFLGTFDRGDNNQKELKYIVWFTRFFMMIYTVNMMIDTYHISGMNCGSYGSEY
mmetsp:Transcript_64304/g.57817  ORF Transcript_64304/g.57817 Transcript_64304/m.57817 type:complete len:431 (-) Transcript_64304:66-1358(-)